MDARVIAATNQDLKQLVAAGKFREDLYHRLDLFRIQIPPLRERGGDILKLAERLIAGLCQRHQLPVKPVSAAGQRRLNAYAWPGNVRELAHELERAIVFEDRAELDFEHLLTAGVLPTATAEEGWFNPAFRFPEEGFDLEKAIRPFTGQAMSAMKSAPAESGDDFVDGAAFLDQAHRPAEGLHLHLFVIEAELMQDRGVQVAVVMR